MRRSARKAAWILGAPDLAAMRRMDPPDLGRARRDWPDRVERRRGDNRLGKDVL
jgi:hypothetical protein